MNVGELQRILAYLPDDLPVLISWYESGYDTPNVLIAEELVDTGSGNDVGGRFYYLESGEAPGRLAGKPVVGPVLVLSRWEELQAGEGF